MGMLLDHRFPGDNRVEREVSALLEAGHKVTIVLFDTGVDRPGFGYDTRRVHLVRKCCPRVPGVRGIYKLIASYFVLVDVGRKINFEALHVHDLPLAAAAIMASRTLRVPLVYDNHENYPGLVQSWGRMRRLRGMLWRAYERWAVGQADAVLTVVEEMRQRLIREGAYRRKFLVLPNSASPQVWRNFGLDREIIDRYQGRRVLTYSGTYGRHKGVHTTVEALARIKDRYPDALLLILADSDDPLRFKLEKRVKELGLENQVEIAGWQPFEKLPSFYAASYAGLVPQAPSIQTEASWPNKLNEVCLAGIPVVAADNRSLKRLVEENGLGVTFKAGDEDSLAQALARLLDDPQEAARLGRQAREWAEGPGSWETHKEVLTNLYARLGLRSYNLR